MGSRQRAEAWGNKNKLKWEVSRSEGWKARVVPPPLHSESQRKKSTSNSLCRSPAQTSRIGRNYCRNAFYWGGAGISLLRMEGRWGGLCLSVGLPLIEVGRRATHPNKAPHDTFTRHHCLRVLVRGFEELRQRDSSKANQEGWDKSACESYCKRAAIIYVCACT